MNQIIKTTTLNAQVAISKMENGLNYLQVLPENPRVGMVEPFCGRGRGQLLSNGTFDFVQTKRHKKKPEFKGPHISLSFGEDGYDRVIFVLPSDQREELPKIYQKESAMVMAYASEHFYHRK